MNQSFKILTAVLLGVTLVFSFEVPRNSLANFFLSVFAKGKIKVTEQKVHIFKTTKTYQDFQNAPQVEDRKELEIFTIPEGGEILSMHAIVTKRFKDSSEPNPVGIELIAEVQSAKECQINNPSARGNRVDGNDESSLPQLLFTHQFCDTEQKIPLFLVEKADRVDAQIQGEMEIFIAYIVYIK